MGFAYTPGLSVAAEATVHKVRRLPIRGDVLVDVGQTVAADDVVAQASLPGEVRPINLATQLGVSPEDVPKIMLKGEDEPVRQGEPLARTHGLFRWFRREYRAPLDATVESISHVTGQVILRGAATPLQRRAYARGEVVAVQPGESATIEVRGTFIQGIFGIGGEAVGPLELIAKSPDEVIDADRLNESHAGRVLVGGSLVTAAAIRRAAELGIYGLVTGGLDDADLRTVLGYEFGVAITGDETVGVTIVVTEGFGQIAMAAGTFDLLARRAGQLASINGATQIRAGVIRPEVLIPLAEAAGERKSAVGGGTLELGTRLRAIREPHFGRLGRCTALPVEPVTLASEARVRVLEVEFDDGTRAVVPRANVELISA
ncbi:MAG: hypothetical protein PVJ57_10045 [Phycisphaerae bacterium]|jgi:hypothetical protein